MKNKIDWDKHVNRLGTGLLPTLLLLLFIAAIVILIVKAVWLALVSLAYFILCYFIGKRIVRKDEENDN